jgi:pyridoxamine 5'-phosphate oxidase
MDLHKLRKEYRDEPLFQKDLPQNPIDFLKKWIEEAVKADLPEPNAMTLATASQGGIPSARTVLLKEVEERGLIFYTDYHSRKAREIEENPRVALVFCWLELERQVVVTGKAEKLSRQESSHYFSKRPRGAQVEAWASSQGTPLSSRKVLEDRFAELKRRFEGKEIPLPDHWGGVLVVPGTLEFWSGRENRLHDRFQYQREGTKWKINRLSP